MENAEAAELFSAFAQIYFAFVCKHIFPTHRPSLRLLHYSTIWPMPGYNAP